MTTDITELAQSLENAASKALIEEGLTWFCEEQLSHEDGIALHKADAEFIALANPTNILALVEALEKAQQRIAELEESNAQVIQSRDHYKRMTEEGLKQLAEARTVKLPDFRHERFNSDWGEHDAEAYQVALREELTAAGIKVEVE